ncbi:hypothetical protein Tco_0785423 [Tanacetum coccineum]
MLPRRWKKKSVKWLVEKHVAKAIEEYEKSRANLDGAGNDDDYGILPSNRNPKDGARALDSDSEKEIQRGHTTIVSIAALMCPELAPQKRED